MVIDYSIIKKWFSIKWGAEFFRPPKVPKPFTSNPSN